jgi:dynein heavy chain
VETNLKKIAIGIKFPFNDDLDLISFLVSADKIGSWGLMGLPNDELSKQNGIIIEKSKRFPLIIDPQNQARTWLERMWKSESEGSGKWITDLNDPRLN